MERRRRFERDQPGGATRGGYANVWTTLGVTGAAVFGTILILKFLDKDFRGEHLEYFWFGTIASLALLAFGVVRATHDRRERKGS